MKSKVFTISLFIFLLLSGASRIFAQESSLTASVDRDSVYIGDHLTYYLKVQSSSGGEVVFEPLEIKGDDFELLDSGTTDIPGGKEQWLVLRSFKVGTYQLPVGKASIRTPAEDQEILEGAPLGITVKSLLPEGDQPPEPRDIRDPVEVPGDYWFLIILVAGVVLAVMLSWFFLRLIRGRGRRVKPSPPPLPPDQVALAELEKIRLARLPEQGRIEEYYVLISGVVRHYLEDRFGLRAPERTTEEFLVEMAQSSSLSGNHQDLVGDFLTQSDLVKFARYGPASHEISEVFAAAIRLVTETRPGLMTEEIKEELDGA